MIIKTRHTRCVLIQISSLQIRILGRKDCLDYLEGQALNIVSLRLPEECKGILANNRTNAWLPNEFRLFSLRCRVVAKNVKVNVNFWSYPRNFLQRQFVQRAALVNLGSTSWITSKVTHIEYSQRAHRACYDLVDPRPQSIDHRICCHPIQLIQNLQVTIRSDSLE